MSETVEHRIDVAWAAGFLEGEGCFGWYGRGIRAGTGYPLVAATQANIEPLARLHSIFPQFTLRETKPSCTGKPTWECRCTGDKALEVMRTVLPLMSERKASVIRDAIEKRELRREGLLRCPKGHVGEFGRREGGSRYCRACQREYARKQKAAS